MESFFTSLGLMSQKQRVPVRRVGDMLVKRKAEGPAGEEPRVGEGDPPRGRRQSTMHSTIATKNTVHVKRPW